MTNDISLGRFSVIQVKIVLSDSVEFLPVSKHQKEIQKPSVEALRIIAHDVAKICALQKLSLSAVIWLHETNFSSTCFSPFLDVFYISC